MELKNQVVSLEIAKQLKSLGVKQSSLWYWVNLGKDFDKNDLVYAGELANGDTNDETVSAFSVAELGEMLPHRLKSLPFKEFNNDALLFEILSFSGTRKAYGLYYEGDTSEEKLPAGFIWNNKEADARGQMLIHLIEKKLITL